MTKSEAIELLTKSIKWFLPYTEVKEEWTDAMNMAIESLRADTVSRSQYQGLLNAIGKVYVEVVRCKDCIHYESDGGALMVCRIDDMVVDDTDYCSYGERREE